jgi:pimeloyl-ACP methyl ester carboxylesterase
VLKAYAGGRLFGSRTGVGQPAVLVLHGWGRTHRDFDAVVSPAGQPLDAIVLDLPGFGASPPPPEPWGSAEYAAAVAPVLEEMDRPVVVLGHSFGGTVAVQLAATRPGDVRALVLTGVPRLVAATGPRRRPSLPFRALRAGNRMGLISDERMEKARRHYGSADYRNAEGVMRQVLVRSLTETLEQQLAAMQCHVEMVWGDDDTAAPLEQARQAAAVIPSAQLTVCPGAGHLTPLTVPGELRAALDRVL